MCFIKRAQELNDFNVFLFKSYVIFFGNSRCNFGRPRICVFEKTLIVSCGHYGICHGSPADYVLGLSRQINHGRVIHQRDAPATLSNTAGSSVLC